MASKKKDTELQPIAKAFLQAIVDGKDKVDTKLREKIQALSDVDRARVAQLAVAVTFADKARYVGALERQLDQQPKKESKLHRRGR